MPGKVAFSLAMLRDAVRQRVDETSIRAVSEEVGMSPSGLHVLLRGSKPHPATREKLVAWYVERRRAEKSSPSIPVTDVDAALRLLIHYVLEDSRRQTRTRRAREIIQRFEREIGTDLLREDG